MDVNAQIKFSVEEPNYEPWLCFKCAVLWALAGYTIKTEIDDYNSDYYMGTTVCEHPKPPKNEVNKNE